MPFLFQIFFYALIVSSLIDTFKAFFSVFICKGFFFFAASFPAFSFAPK